VLHSAELLEEARYVARERQRLTQPQPQPAADSGDSHDPPAAPAPAAAGAAAAAAVVVDGKLRHHTELMLARKAAAPAALGGLGGVAAEHGAEGIDHGNGARMARRPSVTEVTVPLPYFSHASLTPFPTPLSL
jgi:hypothetical protein